MSLLSQFFGNTPNNSLGFVKRIIKGQCDLIEGISGTTITDTINPPLEDINKASLCFYRSSFGVRIGLSGNYQPAGPEHIMVRGKIVDTSTIEFNRTNTTGTITIVWEVTEYY